jgi:PIN domain nuclease of toxin-antitoxin system
MNNVENFDDTKVEKLTLDTHIIIWYSEGIKLSDKQVSLIDKAKDSNSLFISSISIWEIAMLFNRGKTAFSMSLNELIDNILSIPGLSLIDLSLPILIESTSLPNYEHRDPADRLIIASTRSNGSHLMTVDEKIIDYAKRGYLKIVSTYD